MRLAMNWLHCIRYSIKEEIVSNCDASTIKEVRFVDFSAMIESIFPNPLHGLEKHFIERLPKKQNMDMITQTQFFDKQSALILIKLADFIRNLSLSLSLISSSRNIDMLIAL